MSRTAAFHTGNKKDRHIHLTALLFKWRPQADLNAPEAHKPLLSRMTMRDVQDTGLSRRQ
jgi:uncharacterized protein YjiS (DUF1127 family)